MCKTLTFTKKAKLVHGKKYDYSNVFYVSAKIKVNIICPIHGEFQQRPDTHLSGSGCPKCGSITKSRKKLHTNKTFITKANYIHNSKYNYSLVKYVNTNTMVKIICPIHGEFQQTPNTHLSGSGCPKCGVNNSSIKQRKKLDKFIIEGNTLHDDKYDYSKSEYINGMTKVIIICPIHGEFKQTPNKHINCGEGCPKCGDISRKKSKLSTSDIFITKSNLIHNNKYDYSKVKYMGNKIKVNIICPIHGNFKQTPDAHLSGKGCKKCKHITSKPEIQLLNFIKSVYPGDIKSNDRKILHGKEIDILIPDENIGIEFNGLYYHSDLFKTKNYHKDKSELSNNNNITLIHIFEDELLFKREIVESILLNRLNLIKTIINSSDCTIKMVNNNVGEQFLNNNHIDGYKSFDIGIGLYYSQELISLITFTKSTNNNYYELTRFCNKINIDIDNGLKKLFNYFIKKYNPVEVIFNDDKRYPNTKLYENIGFNKISTKEPNYFKVINGKRYISKRYLTKRRKKSTNTSYGIYDCGMNTMIYIQRKINKL